MILSIIVIIRRLGAQVPLLHIPSKKRNYMDGSQSYHERSSVRRGIL